MPGVGAVQPTSKGIRVLFQTQVCDEVCRLVFIPLHYVTRRTALAIARMGEGGGRVFCAQRA
jgi:hypothetical protein